MEIVVPVGVGVGAGVGVGLGLGVGVGTGVAGVAVALVVVVAGEELDPPHPEMKSIATKLSPTTARTLTLMRVPLGGGSRRERRYVSIYSGFMR